jgi:hypothetical protein
MAREGETKERLKLPDKESRRRKSYRSKYLGSRSR